MLQLLYFVFTLLSTEVLSTEVFICENESLYISCPPFHKIHLNYANYGRTSQQNCPKNRYDQNVNCNSADATEVLQPRCEGQQNCIVVVNSQAFGDPCYGTYKYLEMNYTCKINTKNTIVCENNELQIKCPPKTVIEIKSADYGRHSTTICPYEEHDEFTKCSMDVTKKVAQRCTGHPSCKINIKNNEFRKDPCYSTYKYLDVNYICQKRIMSNYYKSSLVHT